MESPVEYDFVIVGGGIAAVSCYEQLATKSPDRSVLLLTASNIVKTVTNVKKIGITMQTFDVTESPSSILNRYACATVMAEKVVELSSTEKKLRTISGHVIGYKKLCLATGGRPRKISDHPRVLTIRDTETVEDLSNRLKTARRIVVVGNGGIATEIVGETKNLEIIWVVKHANISAAFVDAGAAQFFLPHLQKEAGRADFKRRLTHTHEKILSTAQDHCEMGSALGPDWIENFCLSGCSNKRKVHIEYRCSITDVVSSRQGLTEEQLPLHFSESDNWPAYCILSNGKVYGCDYIISAIGVVPNNQFCLSTDNPFRLGEDGGLLVDNQMETSVKDVYAAGDVCTAGWQTDLHWFQVRLWTQARQMGTHAGLCMAANLAGLRLELDICFELFTHVTNFFNFKVVLLGCFNGQHLNDDFETLVRVSKDLEYVKLIVQHGTVHGAILIGDTGLEETVENLIMDAINIESFKKDILNPNIALEDYFD